MTPRIKTAFECLINQWCAWDDTLGEDCSPYGWGLTKEEAIEDLEWQLEDLAEGTPKNTDEGVYAR